MPDALMDPNLQSISKRALGMARRRSLFMLKEGLGILAETMRKCLMMLLIEPKDLMGHLILGYP
jgi:hypothetical protein